MIGDRTEHFEGKGTDLSALQSHIEGYLKGDHFTVQTSAPSAQGTVIQARKGGFLASFVDADRALTIAIHGNPGDFTVRVGIGKWIDHIATAAIETLLVSMLFLPVDVAETAWNVEIEAKLIQDLRSFIG
jgi:hypothetical protein